MTFWGRCVLGVLGVLCLVTAICKYGGSRHAASDSRVGRISLHSHVVDLGVLQPGEIGTAKFQIANVGDDDLHVGRLMGSCGCLSVGIDHHVLRPGATGTIQARFDSTGHWRNTEIDLLICSDDPAHPYEEVRVLAYVRVGIRLDIDRIDLGAGQYGQRLPSGLVNVLLDKQTAPVPVAVEGDRSQFEVRTYSWKTFDELQQYGIEVATRPLNESIGSHAETFRIKAGGRVFPLSVTYRVIPTVKANPTVLVLGNTQTDPTPKQVHLTAMGSDIQFGDVTSLYKKVSLSLRQIGAGDADLCVTAGKTGFADFDIVEVKYRIVVQIATRPSKYP